jgi:hypothetical protein
LRRRILKLFHYVLWGLLFDQFLEGSMARPHRNSIEGKRPLERSKCLRGSMGDGRSKLLLIVWQYSTPNTVTEQPIQVDSKVQHNFRFLVYITVMKCSYELLCSFHHSLAFLFNTGRQMLLRKVVTPASVLCSDISGGRPRRARPR